MTAAPRLAIVGAGAVGTALASRLSWTGIANVLVSRRRQQGDSVELRVQEADGAEWGVRQEVAGIDSLGDIKPETIILAVKAFDTEQLVAQLRRSIPGKPRMVSAQNALFNEHLLQPWASAVAGMVIHFNALLHSDRLLQMNGPSHRLLLGGYPSGVPGWVSELGDDLRRAGFEVAFTKSILDERWQKLLINLDNAFAAICDLSQDELRTDPDALEIRRRIRTEAVLVLDAAGVGYADPPPIVAEQSSPLRVSSYNSTWHDLARGTGTVETDALNGEVVRLGADTGVPTPWNQALLGICTEMAVRRLSPGLYSIAQLRAAVAATERGGEVEPSGRSTQ